MKYILLPLLLCFFSCTNLNKLKPSDTKITRSADMQEEIDSLLAKDAENKKLERQILEDIRVAEKNQDSEAFRFYLQEYMKVERLKLPDWIKKEPNYVEGGLNVKY